MCFGSVLGYCHTFGNLEVVTRTRLQMTRQDLFRFQVEGSNTHPEHGWRLQAYPLNAEGLASCSQNRRNSLLWSAVAADHRGTTVYHTATGKPHTWLLLGALPAYYTLTAPDSALNTWGGGQWQLDESAQLAAAK